MAIFAISLVLLMIYLIIRVFPSKFDEYSMHSIPVMIF